MYVVGGNAPGGVPTGRVDVFDPVTGTWSMPLPPMPTPSAHFSLVAAGTMPYAIGGDTAPNNTAVTDVVERIDTTQPAAGWSTVAPMPTPRPFTAAGALNNGSLIVVVGGQQVNGPALNRTELYNVATNQWTQGANILAPTSGAASAVVQNALFVFGGFSNGPLILAELYRPATAQQPDGWAALTRHADGPQRSRSRGRRRRNLRHRRAAQRRERARDAEAFSILEPDQFSLS
jgi:hypothetical protein